MRSIAIAASKRFATRRLGGAEVQWFQLNSGRLFSVSSATSSPKVSALGAATQRLRDAVKSHEVTAEIVAEADAPVDRSAVLQRLGHELRSSDEHIEVTLLGNALQADGTRKTVVVKTPTGPQGGPAVRSIHVVLPNADDMSRLVASRRENKVTVPKAEELAIILDQYYREKFLGKAADHVALLTAWGPKAIGDSEGEFSEVAALMSLALRAYKAAIKSAKEDFQFEVHRAGEGRECLVMPPSNFALLGLKDAFHMLLKGFRVILVVQPRFLPHFQEIQKDLVDCGLPDGLVEVIPGITPEADPAVLHEVLRHVDRLQFTGSSAMFKALVLKAYELGNLRLEHAGEVSGLNKVRLDAVSVLHPAVATGTAWAAMANNGELCTSASLVEFDPKTGDTAETVKAALEANANFRIGRDPADERLDILLRDGKAHGLEVKTQEPPEGFHEWWEKTILAAPRSETQIVRTNQSLGHCVYAPSIERAVSLGTKEDASNIYCVGLPKDPSAPSARAGTTGAKIPESVFGGMKTYTYAVAGDHDGVGSVQTLFDTVRRRGTNWRDQEETFAEYELTETAEMLLEFLEPQQQKAFSRQVSNVLEVFKAFMPEVTKAYNGQPLVGAEGRSQLVTLQALKSTRKQLLIPRGVGLPEDIVKLALLCEMSPLRGAPVDLHLLEAQQAGKLRVTDPLKSFLRIVEKTLGWRLHWHEKSEDFTQKIRKSEYPPYFFCIKDKHHSPLEVLQAVAEQGGYLYEGFPKDSLTLFRWLTSSQAWTVSCTEDQVQEANEALLAAWMKTGLRQDPLPEPEIIQPRTRGDVGGGFSDFGSTDLGDDKSWAELSDDEDSDDEPVDKEKKSEKNTKA